VQLYTSLTTPFGRKVAVMLHESGKLDRVELIHVAGTPLAPGSMPVDTNPLGKIPVLITDNGQAIFDSRVICRYLEDRLDAGLYPKGDALWPVLALEALADGIIDAGILMSYETRLRPEDKQFVPWIDAQWAKITRSLDAIEARSMPLLDGPLHMGQVALGAAFGFLALRHGGRNWQADRPRIAAWAEGFAQRPSMLATVPKA
jgi:glutathione S-transferase